VAWHEGNARLDPNARTTETEKKSRVYIFSTVLSQRKNQQIDAEYPEQNPSSISLTFT